jgi:hypothetical protein
VVLRTLAQSCLEFKHFRSKDDAETVRLPTISSFNSKEKLGGAKVESEKHSSAAASV